jgi:hypothetical protein
MNSSLGYRLRKLKPDNPVEIERINLMFYHPEVIKFMGYKQSEIGEIRRGDLQKVNRSMFKSPSSVSRNYREVTYAVAETKNKLIGWIWFCIDTKHPFPARVAKRLGLTAQNSRSYQVVYEKLLSSGWPKALVTKVIHIHPSELEEPRKGVIVEGLRLAIGRLSREYRKLSLHKRHLALYAYVLPDNLASQKVLVRNRFVKETKQYRYDGLIHDLWIRIC